MRLFGTRFSDTELAAMDASAAPSVLWPGSIDEKPLTPCQEVDVQKIIAAVAIHDSVDWNDVQELSDPTTWPN